MNKKGFTLVEVIATVALLAILIGLAGTSLIKKYNESKKEAIIIQEGQLVQSGDMVIQDYCKNPLSEGYQLQCDNYYQSYEDINNNLIIEDNTYTKYICVKDLKKLGYYSEELRYSGVDCSGVVIYKIDYETDLQKDSYSVIKCGEDYTTEVENVNDYLTIFKECFETQNSEQPEEEKKYLLTVNFTELTPNGMKVGISHSKEYKKGQSISIDVPEHKTFENEYTPFKHGSSVNANNFKLSSDKTKLTGTMPEGNVTVNIVYSASTYVLTVNYKEFNDVQGNINFPSKQFIMFYGEKTEIPYEEKENFKVISPSDFTYEMQQEDAEVNVIYQQVDFDLTYDSNGGTACSSKKITYNKAFGTLCSPTRTGYTFDGWYLNGSKVTSTTVNTNYNNITLTAKWNVNKYVVIYDCNGGTPTSNYSSEHTYDQTSNLASNRCVKTGSVFTLWKDSEGNTYTNQKEIKNLRSENNDSITLTAQWKPLTYYIAFNSNSGSGTMNKMTVTYGQVVNLTSNAFTRTGHRFDGWNGSDGKTYADRAAISNLTTVNGSTITMTAKWTKCGAGTYLANNVCTACAAGTYSTGGVNSCTICPAGSYCPGGTNKKVCPAGKYTSSTGASSCTVCPAGKYNSGTGNTTCSNCPVGYYSSAGASSCTGCPAGKYSTGGASSCTTCQAGYYCPGSSNRIACPAGQTSDVGSDAASDCYLASSLPTLAYTGTFQVVKDDNTAISSVLTNTTFVGTNYTYRGTWKVRFLTSGTLTFTSLGSGASGIDIFLVGGGGKGATGGEYRAISSRGGGGGGGGSTTNVTKFPATVGTSYTLNIAGAGGSSNWKVGSTTYYNTNGGGNGCSPTYTDGGGYDSCAGSGGALVNHSNYYGATNVESRKGSSGGSGGSITRGNDGVYEFYGSSGNRYGAGGGAGGSGSSTGTGSGFTYGQAGGTTGGGRGGTGCDYEPNDYGRWDYVPGEEGTVGTANTGSGGGGGGGACGANNRNHGYNAYGASGGTGIIIIRNTR